MLNCIVCSKQMEDGESLSDEDGVQASPKKQAVKALTAQIKDIAIKASGAYKNCKPCSSGFTGNDKVHSFGRTGSSIRNLKAFSSGSVTPISASERTESVFMEEEESKGWVAQVEPGVLITFVSLAKGGNDLKRIQFSRDIFDTWQAQQWWAENCERVMELYNVQRSGCKSVPLPTPPESDGGASKLVSPEDSPMSNKPHPPSNSQPASGHALSKQGSQNQSNSDDVEDEWVEEDEPGVYITIRSLPNGVHELRRVRFRREMFGETEARTWWEQNKARIQKQYL